MSNCTEHLPEWKPGKLLSRDYAIVPTPDEEPVPGKIKSPQDEFSFLIEEVLATDPDICVFYSEETWQKSTATEMALTALHTRATVEFKQALEQRALDAITRFPKVSGIVPVQELVAAGMH